MVDDCYFLVKGGVENTYGKVNILLQTFISRGYVDSFSLVSDLGYVAQVESSLQIAILHTFLSVFLVGLRVPLSPYLIYPYGTLIGQ